MWDVAVLCVRVHYLAGVQRGVDGMMVVGKAQLHARETVGACEGIRKGASSGQGGS
jgi:hypothetical protein